MLLITPCACSTKWYITRVHKFHITCIEWDWAKMFCFSVWLFNLMLKGITTLMHVNIRKQKGDNLCCTNVNVYMYNFHIQWLVRDYSDVQLLFCQTSLSDKTAFGSQRQSYHLFSDEHVFFSSCFVFLNITPLPWSQ